MRFRGDPCVENKKAGDYWACRCWRWSTCPYTTPTLFSCSSPRITINLGLSFPPAYLCFICTGGGSELERRGKFREGFPTKGYISIFKTRWKQRDGHGSFPNMAPNLRRCCHFAFVEPLYTYFWNFSVRLRKVKQHPRCANIRTNLLRSHKDGRPRSDPASRIGIRNRSGESEAAWYRSARAMWQE